jgi:hypothetical protein
VLAAAPALADFSGQTILGPLTLGSVVNGNTVGATDDNDGITSGMHIFNIWNGPDDVYSLNWTGGDMALQLVYNNTLADLDLFLYTPDSLDDSGNFSIINSGIEDIAYPGGAAGTYYVLIDSPDAATAGAYTLSVTPEPSMLALVGLGAALCARRGR